MLTFYLQLACGVIGAVLSVSWLVQVRLQLCHRFSHLNLTLGTCTHLHTHVQLIKCMIL